MAIFLDTSKFKMNLIPEWTIDGSFAFLYRKPNESNEVIEIMMGNVQGLVSNGSKSLENSYVFDIINAGKITEMILIPTIPRVTKKAV